jgi:hypothetical protein
MHPLMLHPFGNQQITGFFGPMAAIRQLPLFSEVVVWDERLIPS